VLPAEAAPIASFAPDSPQPFTLFPTFGHGWFRQSAVLAHRSGRHFEQRIDRCEIERIEPGRALRVELVDRIAALRIRIALAFDANDVLTLSTELINEGEDVLELQWLAAGVLPLPDDAHSVRSYTGRHLDEFRLQVDTLSRALWRRENRRGLTSHDCFPGAVVVTEGTTANAGLAYGAHLAWSGNHAQTIESLDDGAYQWQMGEWLAPGEIRLAPGDSHISPVMLAVCSTEGLNGLAQSFHRALRARLDWPGGVMRPRPVSINTWEGFYFDHDIEKLKQLADQAAAIGVERFVLDDGWFHGRHNDRAGLGDWRSDSGKYPQGLGPLVDHVCRRGLEFGLWIEPEMVNPDSDVFRAHPDWALEIAGRPRLTARNQLVLDLSRAAVSDYLFGAIDALLRQHRIAYLKWDHNRDLATAGGADGHARYHRQVDAAYALMARIRAAHRGVEIESCAGGGGRIDFGVLRFAHRVWTSDNIDARSRLAIQRGFLQFFPPEIMGAHVGAAPAHTTGRSQSLDFRAAVALPGHLGVELDLAALDEMARARLATWVALYKELRPSLHAGLLWLGEAADGVLWEAHGAQDAGDLVVFAYRLEPATRGQPTRLTLPMVDRSRLYRVERIEPRVQSGDEKALARELQSTCGETLASIGVTLPAMKAESCVILRLRRGERVTRALP